MKHGNGYQHQSLNVHRERKAEENSLHPAWREFLRYCHELRHGEIERLKIQDGLPVIAEITREKIKFTA